MRKFTFLLSLLLAVFTTAMAQVDTNKEYRVKDVGTGKYMNASNYDAHPTGPLGGVNFVDVAESDDQVFTFFKTGTDYMLRTKSGKYLVCQPWNVDALDAQGSALTFVDNGDGTYYIMNGSKYFKVEYVKGNPVATIDGQQVEQAQVSGYFPYCDAAYGAAAKFELEVVETVVEPEPEVPGTPAELAETYNGKVSMEFFGSPYELNAQIVFGKDENGAAKEGYATLKIWETENFNVEVVECVPYEVTATTVVLKGVTVGAGDGSVDTKQVDLTFVVNADGTLSCSEKVYGPTPDTAFLQFDFGAGVFTPEAGSVEPEPEPEVPATPVVITEVAQLSNAKCYTLVSSDTGRGGMYALADKVDMCGVTYNQAQTCHGVARDNADPKQQFAFVEYEGKHYLYSVSEKKFVMKSGDTNALVGEAPFEFVTVEKVGESTFALKANDTNYFTASPGWCSNPSRGTCIQSTLTSKSKDDGWDEGAWFTITEVADFNADEAIAMLTPAAPVVEPLALVKANPELETEVTSLNSITLTFNKEIASVSAEPGMFWFVNADMTNMYDAEVQINATDAKTLTITLAEEIKEAGTYLAMFSQGALVAADGSSNETAVELAWTVKPEVVEPEPTELELVKANPELETEVSSLGSITLTFNKEIASVTLNESTFFFMAKDFSKVFTTADVQVNATDAKSVTLTLPEVITAEGEYVAMLMNGAVVATDGTSNQGIIEMAWTVKAAPVEPEVPVATLEPVSVDPAEPEWWDAMEDIENIAINFPEDITYNAEKPVTVVFNSEEYVEVSVAVNADDAKQLVVTFPKNLKIGEYVVNVPEGAVVAVSGATCNPALSYTYNVDYAYNTFEPTSITPAAGKVESLKEIVLDFGPNDYPGTNGLDMDATFELTNAQGETVATGKLSYSGWTAAAVTLDKEITELGLYTITIPEGVIWNSKVDGTADRGVHKGARCNPTIELVYSIGEAATVTEVTPVPGHYEEIPADIAVTFSKEIATVNYLILRNKNTGMRGYYFAEDEYKVEGNKLSFSLPADMIEFAAEATVQIQVMDKDGFPVTYAASEDDMAEGYVMLVYTAPVRADIFTATKVDPKEGEVTELSVFNVTFESLKSSEGMSYVGGFDESKVVEVLDAEGNQVATAEMEVVNSVYREEYEGEVYEFEYPSSVAKFTLNKTITEPGTYTFVIPEATVFNEGYYPDSEDFGIGWGALYNPEVRLVYTIKDASAISGVEVEAANGKVYNLQGVRVGNKLQKGVYIVNGKKVYVK